jgi:glutathione peroxidase
MKNRPIAFIAAVVLGSAALQMVLSADAQSTAAKSDAKTDAKTMSVYNFKLKSLDGKDVDLAKYKGKTLLIVNTASKCGFTKQYAGLQALNEKYGKQGLAIVGFPANNFGGQEPGTAAEIGEFCQKNYGVTFDMMEKVSVKGADKTPLFDYLTTKANPEMTGEIGWNFEKFLISRDGKLVNRFKSAVAPDATELTKAVEAELAKKVS